MSPEKSIRSVGRKDQRWYHSSHSWVVTASDNTVYVGIDNFLPELFSKEVYFSHLPAPGEDLNQGDKAWDVGLADRKVPQYLPISGKVVEINPAVTSGVALSTQEMEKSWVMKIKATDLDNEKHNLVSHAMAMRINRMHSDELKWSAQQGHYLNDGGVLDPGYIARMSNESWFALARKFFQFNNDKQ